MTESIYISKLKKAATKLRKQEQIKHSEALDKVAQQAGFIGWHDLMTQMDFRGMFFRRRSRILSLFRFTNCTF